MQRFETSYLTDESVYTMTKNAFEKLKEIDRRSEEAIELEKRLKHWVEASGNMEAFIEKRGSRYKECTFENYHTTNKHQEKVVNALIDYSKRAKEMIAKGKNVLLIGSKGTGKDHLLCALAKRCFMESGLVPRWKNGVDLLEQFHRDALNGSSWLTNPLGDASILYVSDPVPPVGGLSESKQSAMFKLIDQRYSQMKPTWMTLNVADGKDAEARMGSQTVDRLRHGALVLFCNWESYRNSEH